MTCDCESPRAPFIMNGALLFILQGNSRVLIATEVERIPDLEWEPMLEETPTTTVMGPDASCAEHTLSGMTGAGASHLVRRRPSGFGCF